MPNETTDERRVDQPAQDPAAPIPRQPPLQEKILEATQEPKDITGKAAKKVELSSEEQQEIDLWWGAYAGRTMTPSFIICALLTGLLILLVWNQACMSSMLATWIVPLGLRAGHGYLCSNSGRVSVPLRIASSMNAARIEPPWATARAHRGCECSSSSRASVATARGLVCVSVNSGGRSG